MEQLKIEHLEIAEHKPKEEHDRESEQEVKDEESMFNIVFLKSC